MFAKAHDHAGQIAGLEQAVRNIKANCTDEGLLKEQKERVNKLRGEVDERLLALQKARVSGKPGKVADKQSKLEQAQTNLLEAQRELGELNRLVKKSRVHSMSGDQKGRDYPAFCIASAEVTAGASAQTSPSADLRFPHERDPR
ncbi:MAG: DUF1090 domain-containing protein [Aeromonas sp.]|uniref:DUF1090 domain-containing protein n=1 Tax=Aeromonas sp. TaxID=647 RepID=UPI003D6AEAE6